MPEKRIHGRTVRTLKKSPRIGLETFWLDLGTGPFSFSVDESIAEDEALVVGEYEFENEPARGPLTIYSRVLADAQDAPMLAANYFPRNIDVYAPPDPGIEIDARGLPPLDDEDFWSIIDVLEQRLWEKTFNKAAAALSKKDDTFILRFAQAAAQKLFQLDTPERTMSDGQISVEWESDFQRGAILGGGRERFELVLENPDSFDRSWMTDHASMPRAIASLAYEKKHQRTVTIITSWNTEAGSNHAIWGNRVPEYLPDPSPDEQAEIDEVVAEIYAALASSREPQLQDLGAGLDEEDQWWAARALILEGPKVIERLTLFSASGELDHDGVLAVATDALTVSGGTVVSSIDLIDTHMAMLMSGEVFTIKRRSSLPIDEYIRRFVRVPRDT